MKRHILMVLCLILAAALCPAAYATEPDPIRISTVEQLQAIAEDPAGSYILMNDLDLTGVAWKPIDLNGGSFDGNGHAIVNLTVTRVGETADISYDGNAIAYETGFAGFFGVLRNASVTNLRLVNVRALVECDTPCFLGSIAGAMYDSSVTDCSVSGSLELRAWDRMFGVGGLVGYGSGRLERCEADVTLICTDTGKDSLDEQFLGGAVATGYIDVVDCAVTLDGYVSEYGYVHNGGLIGMVMQYPLGNGRTGYLTGNTISGKITFFECNKDRRAYCDAYIGETLTSAYSRKNNTSDFLRDERKDYAMELRPEMCEDPAYAETVAAPGCDSFGYTEFTCQTCGYTYTDSYTLPAHRVTDWTVTMEPTTEQEGLCVGYCDGCGVEFTQTVPKLEPEPTESTAASEPQPTEPAEAETTRVGWVVSFVAAAVVALAVLLLRLRKKGKYQE